MAKKDTQVKSSRRHKVLAALKVKHVSEDILAKAYGDSYIDKLGDKYRKYVSIDGNLVNSKGKPKLADQVYASFALDIRNELVKKGLTDAPKRGKSAKPLKERLLEDW